LTTNKTTLKLKLENRRKKKEKKNTKDIIINYKETRMAKDGED